MLKRISVVLSVFVLFLSCSEDPTGSGDPTGVKTLYPIYSMKMEKLGDVVVNELDNGSFEFLIDLSTTFSESTDIDLYDDNAADKGSMVATIGIIDASTTDVFYEKPGSLSASYDQFLNYDGHILFTDGSGAVAWSDVGENALTGEIEDYPMYEVDFPGMSGAATVYKRKNGASLFVLNIVNTQAGGNHPAHIHTNTVAMGGGVGISLSNLNGDTGMSYTNIERRDNGSTMLYNDLINFNGYVAVHNSSSDFGRFVVQGDIGQNKFTGNSIEYEARATSADGVSGTVTFQERVSGNTLVTINLPNDLDNVNHPVHIHRNTAADGGSVFIDLTTFNGTGYTEVSQDNSGNPLTYGDMLELDGYVNVHKSSSELGINLAQADVGINAFTGDKKEYVLNEVNSSGISGTALFEKRVSNETLITLNMTGLAGINRATHIHENSVETGGGILINLSQINAATGISVTNITQQNSGAPITYDDLMSFDGHIAVHTTPTGGAYTALGNIGSNAN